MKIFVSAGETSGDIHAAALVSEIKLIDPSIHFFGVGSEALKKVGVNVVEDISPKGSIGLLEALPNIFSIYKVFSKIKRLIREEKPDAVLLVDSQGFNLPLAKYAKSLGIKTIYYIPPQEWLWGTKKGIQKVAQYLDLVLAIFKKEEEAYKEAGAETLYFGHPLPEIIAEEIAQDGGGVSENSRTILVCPGSRTHEVKTLFPIFLEACKILHDKNKNLKFKVLIASSWIESLLRHMAEELSDLKIEFIREGKYKEMKGSSFIIATSGTINLEASIIGTPNIMVYKLSPLTYWIGKNILKIDKKLQFFSMPNILLKRKFIPELIQKEATPENIVREVEVSLQKGEILDNMELVMLLGDSKPLEKLARGVVDFLRR